MGIGGQAMEFDDIFDGLEGNREVLTPELMEEHNRRILRNIKIDITLGNLELSPQRNRISPELWKKCEILTKKGFAIGGSVCLKLYGLVDRPSEDFDIFKEGFKYNPEIMNVVNDYDGDVDIHEDFNRAKLHTKMGIMDIFDRKVDSEMFEGVRLAEPLSAYDAKIRYNRRKDYEDFKVLEEKYKKMLNKENYLFI